MFHQHAPAWVMFVLAFCIIGYGYWSTRGSKPDPGKTPDQEDDPP